MSLHAIRRAALLVVALASCASLTASTQAPAELDDLLARAGVYVAAYEKDLSAVVAEEDYTQRVDPSGHAAALGIGAENRLFVRRRLRSDFAIVWADDAGWLPFRDVFEVDGRPVRDRQNRLAALFAGSTAVALVQADQITAESARFNIGVTRTINVPTFPLPFLRAESRHRFRFQPGGASTIEGVRTVEVRYTEVGRPTVIRGPNNTDLPASGSFWIDPDTGRVIRTMVGTNDGRLRTEIQVTYREDPRLAVWVPAEMKERYETRSAVAQGTASYSNFRRFQVGVRIK